MQGISKALQQPEYVHVILNHLPITGLFVALLGLVVALSLKGRAPLMLALALVGLLSLSAWPVAEYGGDAFDRVLSISDDAGRQYLKNHEALADRWIFLFYLTAAAAAAALVIGWKWPRHLRKAAAVVALLAAASLVAGALIAESGGQIRHREFRYSPPVGSQSAPAEAVE
jgi:hypothetical protein